MSNIKLKKICNIIAIILFLNCFLNPVIPETEFGDVTKYLLIVYFTISLFDRFRNVHFHEILSLNNILLVGVLLILGLNLFRLNAFSFSTFSAYTITILSIIVFTSYTLDEEKMQFVIKSGLVISCMVLMCLFIKIYFVGDFNRMDFFFLGKKFHPNYQTLYLLVPLLLGYNMLDCYIGKFNNIFTKIVIVDFVLGLFVIFKMQTRTLLLVYCLTAIWFISKKIVELKNKNKLKKFLLINKRKIYFFLSIISILLIVLIVKDSRLIDIYSLLTDHGSGRTDLWLFAIDLSVERFNLLGIGMTEYLSSSYNYFININQYLVNMVPHNAFISLLIDCGFIGASLFITYLVRIMAKCFKQNKWDIIYYADILICMCLVDGFTTPYIFVMIIFAHYVCKTKEAYYHA